MLKQSTHALMGSAHDAYAQWENVEGTRRIVTYTRFVPEQAIDDRGDAEAELLVRTLGGRVGHIGQLVHGAARLELDKRQVLFLAPVADSVYRVAEMAQGHYLLRPDDDGLERLQRSPNLPHLQEPDMAAVRLLPGKTVEQVHRILLRERSGTE